MHIDPVKIAQQYKYCFKCGGKLNYKGGNLLICGSCRYHNYINPLSANGAVLKNKNGEILLVVRKNDPQKGFWDLPGGFVDLNENAEESMERELKEELGISIKKLKYLTSYPDEYFYGGVTFGTLILLFEGSIDGQKFEAKDDVSDFKFFKPSEIPFEQIAFEGLKKALRKITHR